MSFRKNPCVPVSFASVKMTWKPVSQFASRFNMWNLWRDGGNTFPKPSVLSQNSSSSRFLANGWSFVGNCCRTSKREMYVSRKFEGFKRAAESPNFRGGTQWSQISQILRHQVWLKVVFFFFWVYQSAILECNEPDTNYFLNCFAGFQGIVFFLKGNNESICEIPMSITCQIWKLLNPKHGAFFVQDNPWCECEK